MATQYTLVENSSCYLESYWDTGTNPSSRQQVYRLRKFIPEDPVDDHTKLDYPFSSVITRNKIRGRGRCLQLRFESEEGKDFQLQGYEVINAKPK